MNNQTKKHRGVCRLTVAKIVDSGPIPSNHIDIDLNEKQISLPEPTLRPSPPQKRSISPVLTSNVVNNKKIKIEQPIIKKKKAQSQSMIKNEGSAKITVNNKKPSNKSLPITEEKAPKIALMKESNEIAENSSLSKPRKLMKTQSNIDIKSSTIITKKKESGPSPSKTKLVTNSQPVLKKTTNKNSQKISIKTEQTTSPIAKSPSTIVSSNNNTTITTRPMSKLKKIPKKSAPRPSSVIIPKDSPKLPSSSSKTAINPKQKRSSSMKNDNNSKINQSEKSNHFQSPSKSSQPIITTSITNSPSTEVYNKEDIHIEFSDESNSPNPSSSTKIVLNRVSHSDQSDSNISTDDDENLPTSLIDDDLRYKLIYIYNRFQLNSLNDLIIFVRFFQRNHLIDPSQFSMTKTTNEMFTYDLFSLSSLHINELANDLGFTPTVITNSIEQ